MKFPDVRTLVEVVLALGTVVGAVLASPMLLSKARLIRERDDARSYAALLERRLTALGGGADVADSIVERLAAEVRELRAEAAATRAEVVETRTALIASAQYNATLIVHIRKRGSVASMPEPPPEISSDVLTALRARENEQTASTQGAAGVVTTGAPA